MSVDNRILLMGNPNVGKSVFFTELTGIHAVSSNFAGTTVSFMEGQIKLNNQDYTLIDVPGTYSMTPSSEAESVASQFMESGAAAVICVLDASNLERNLRLGLELKRYKLPLIYALNLTDVAERQGISINARLLSQELNAPIVQTIAIRRQGFDELVNELETILDKPPASSACESCPRNDSQLDDDASWSAAKEIARRVIKKTNTKPGFLERLGDSMMKPMPGVPISFLVMALTIAAVLGGGRALRAGILLPLVNNIIVPFFRNIFESILPQGALLNILVGEFGIFVISFEWILALVFPYVLFFYIAFTFLEDTGYLPRLSVLFDNIMNKLGVQGGSLIHLLMGYGCAVPAIIGTRALSTRKERIIITAAICFAIPCISQTGAIISLLSDFYWWMMPAMMLFSIVFFIIVTLICGKLVAGKVDPLLIEIPNLLIPSRRAYFRKLAGRMRHFLHDAQVPMMIAILIAALLSESGLLEVIAYYARPLMTRWLGLPEEAVVALVLGIVRREMSVAPLIALNLTPLQAFVGGAVSLMYLPCLSVFAILNKEFKTKVAVIIAFSTIAVAIFVGGVINQVGLLFV